MPEVANGAYSKQIDIYACGVMLYEMLTGDIPFKGESWAEIALKHQTDLPDMRKVPKPYIAILQKALNKKAESRYANMSEMIEAVERVGQPLPVAMPQSPTLAIPSQNAELTRKPMPMPLSNQNSKALELCTSLLGAPLAAAPLTGIWALVTGVVDWGSLGSLFLTIVAISWAVLITTKGWEGQKRSMSRRLARHAGALVGIGVFWLDGWSVPQSLDRGVHTSLAGASQTSYTMLHGYMFCFAMALFIPRWWLSAERKRRERFSLFPLIATAFWGMIVFAFALAMMMGGPAETQPRFMPVGYFMLVLASAAAVVQMVTAHTPPPPYQPRFLRRLYEYTR